MVAAVGAAEGLIVVSTADDKPNNFKVDFRATRRSPRWRADRRIRRAVARRLGEGSTPTVAAWTDDYSDIMGAILRKKLGR